MDNKELQDEVVWLRDGLKRSEEQRKEAADIYARTRKQLEEEIEALKAELLSEPPAREHLDLIEALRQGNRRLRDEIAALKHQPVGPCTADAILDRAAGHMRDRAATYDAPGGERSMGKVAAIARVLYADQLARGEYTEEMAWGLQVVLKLVRSSQGGYRPDNYEDMAAYAALMGESAGRGAANA